MKNSERQTLATQFHEEQDRLHDRISEWRSWWEELSEWGEPRFGEMAQRLRLIRDRLRQHFQHEESAECYEQISRIGPKYREESDRLVSEHGPLIDRLEYLCAQLEGCEPGIDCWGDAKRMFEEFLQELRSHERDENTLIDCWSREN